MKEFKLFLGEYGVLGTHEATDDKDYRMAVETVTQLRDRMLNEQVLREPILSIFQGVYDDDTKLPEDLKSCTPVADQVSNKAKIREIRPDPPADNDVIDFLQNAFPDLYLVDFPPIPKMMVWGETLSGRSQANAERVSINAELTNVWLKKTSSSAVSSPALAFLFLAIFLHEFGHSALVWYGQGLCNAPKLGEVDREAGEYMEMRFFGGIVKGAFDTKTMDIKDVGLAKGDDFYSINNNRSVELSKLDTTNGLPCFNLFGLSPDPKTPHTRRFKLWPVKSSSSSLSPRHIPGSNIRPFLVGDKKVMP